MLTPRPKPQNAELPPFVTARQVAAMLGYDSRAGFYRNRHRLEQDHAFPLPLPTSIRNLRWRRDAIECWLAEQGRPRADAVATRPQGPNVYLLEEARRA